MSWNIIFEMVGTETEEDIRLFHHSDFVRLYCRGDFASFDDILPSFRARYSLRNEYHSIELSCFFGKRDGNGLLLRDESLAITPHSFQSGSCRRSPVPLIRFLIGLSVILGGGSASPASLVPLQPSVRMISHSHWLLQLEAP